MKTQEKSGGEELHCFIYDHWSAQVPFPDLIHNLTYDPVHDPFSLILVLVLMMLVSW